MADIRGYTDTHLKMIFRDIDHKRVPLPKVNLDYTDYNAKQAIFLEGIYLKYPELKGLPVNMGFKDNVFTFFKRVMTSDGWVVEPYTL